MSTRTQVAARGAAAGAGREVRPTDQPPEGAAHAGARPVLSFTAKRRGKPPSHLADLDAAGRKAVLAGMGLPPFRADQLSRHYFERFEADRSGRIRADSDAFWTMRSTSPRSSLELRRILDLQTGDRGRTPGSGSRWIRTSPASWGSRTVEHEEPG